MLSMVSPWHPRRECRSSPRRPLPVSGLATQRHQHYGDGSSNDEVEEPLGRGGVRHVHGPQSRRGDLAGVDPAGGPPAELEEAGAGVSLLIGRARRVRRGTTYAANRKMQTNAIYPAGGTAAFSAGGETRT